MTDSTKGSKAKSEADAKKNPLFKRRVLCEDNRRYLLRVAGDYPQLLDITMLIDLAPEVSKHLKERYLAILESDEPDKAIRRFVEQYRTAIEYVKTKIEKEKARELSPKREGRRA